MSVCVLVLIPFLFGPGYHQSCDVFTNQISRSRQSVLLIIDELFLWLFC